VPFGVLQLPRLSRRRRRGSVEVRLGYTDGDWLTSGGATSRRRRSPGPVRWRFVLWCAWVVGSLVLVGLLYLASVHAYPASSDGASVILEGKALLGNFTLTHWALSLDSFWLVDAPVYSVAVLVGGVHPQLLHLVPAVIAVGVIGVGAWIAQRGRSRRSGLVAAGTVVLLLGLPTHAFAQFFLIGPFHVVTTLCASSRAWRCGELDLAGVGSWRLYSSRQACSETSRLRF